ncbi:MAG TPA: hypothetical protein V6D17_09710 [Candidatus Obscuribacterales bacterium]
MHTSTLDVLPEAQTRSAASASPDWKRDPVWLALACIVLMELVAFGLWIKEVGVYLDEWIYFGRAHFGDQSLLGLFSQAFTNPKIIVRPLNAIHLGTIYYLVKEQPLLYHASNALVEAAAGCFLFLSIRRLFADWRLSLASALLFIVYPSHDETHYSIVAFTLGMGVALFAASFWLFIKGVQEGKNGLIGLSGFVYALSLFEYELCLPFYALFPAVAFLNCKYRRGMTFSRALKSALLAQIPVLIAALSFVWFRQWLLPALELGWRYHAKFDPAYTLSVFVEGFKCSIFPQAFGYFAGMAADYLRHGVPIERFLSLAGVIALAMFTLAKGSNSGEKIKDTSLVAIFCGILSMMLAYTIYSIADGYTPVLDNCNNRVNAGASIGASLALAGALLWLTDRLPAPVLKNRGVAYAALLCPLLSMMVLADWEFRKPWVTSWQSQKEARRFIESHRSDFRDGDSIILFDFVRYVRWAPVLDGVWDFQTIVRTTLENENINATVASERMHISRDGISDRQGSIVLANLPYKRMFLWSPMRNAWQMVNSEAEFWSFAKKYGLDLSLCKIEKE